MSSSLKTQLYTATALTFEELGFILPASELNEDQWSSAMDAAVTVPFEGPLRGRLELEVFGGILRIVVANMLGAGDGRSIESQHDALGELANVICGNILPALAGDQATFNLGTPRLVPAASLSRLHQTPTVGVDVGLDKGRASVFLYIEGGPGVLSGTPAA